MGLVLSAERRVLIEAAIRGTGRSLRAISEEFGCSWKTVRRIADRLSADRGCCGCGRPSGHKGHCRVRLVVMALRSGRKRRWAGGRRPVWTDAADEVLRLGYPSGVAMVQLRAEVGAVLGRAMSAPAIWDRAGKLGLKRASMRQALLASGSRVGRPAGTKNSRPYVRVGWRPTRPITLAAIEADLVFEYLIERDYVETELAFHRALRVKRSAARHIYNESRAAERLKWAAIIDRQAAAAEEADRKRRAAREAKAAQRAAKASTVERFVHPAHLTEKLALATLNRLVSPVENVLPTARADPATKGVPYRMAAFTVPDPMREVRLRQMAEAGRGRV